MNKIKENKKLFIFNPTYIGLFLLIVFSGFFITSLPLSPIYFSFILSLLFFFISLFNIKNYNFGLSFYLAISFFIYLSFSQLFLNPNTSTYVNYTFSIVCYILSYLFLPRIDKNKIITISKYFINFSIPLLIYESFYRITNPIFFTDFESKGKEDLIFYYYKVNSIMYEDSNYVAFFILSLLTFSYFLKHKTNINLTFQQLILFVLLLLTLSRSAIITFIIFIIFIRFRKKILKNKFIFLLLSFPVLILIAYFINEIRASDDSLGARFSIIELTVEYINKADFINILFGSGLGNSVDVIGIGGHNLFVTFIIETGFAGTLLFICFLLTTMIKSKLITGYVIIPIIINGFVFAPGAIPYVYVIIAIIQRIEILRQNEK